MRNEGQGREREGRGTAAVLLCEVHSGRGPGAAEAAMRLVGAALEEAVRGEDTVARWGGDELVVLLEGATLAEAEEVARRLAAAVEGAPADGPEDRPAVSIGIAKRLAGEELLDTVSRADVALREARWREAAVTAA